MGDNTDSMTKLIIKFQEDRKNKKLLLHVSDVKSNLLSTEGEKEAAEVFINGLIEDAKMYQELTKKG